MLFGCSVTTCSKDIRINVLKLAKTLPSCPDAEVRWPGPDALKEYADMLVNYGFLRTHQSHLVNIAYIKSWLREDGGSLLLNDRTKIPVSKLKREQVKEALAVQFKL